MWKDCSMDQGLFKQSLPSGVCKWQSIQFSTCTFWCPPGLRLGPVLFLLYINDITEHIQSTMRLFADDSVIYREIKNICDHALLQQDLISLCEWAETWQLNFNISKCYHLGVTNKVVSFSHYYLMNNVFIAKSASTINILE